MPDIGWTELLVIAVLAIVVVGPKDLPRVMREVGRWAAAARRAAREFQASLEDMARQAEIDELNEKMQSQGLTRKMDYHVPGGLEVDPTSSEPHTGLPAAGEAYEPPGEESEAETPATPEGAVR